MNETTMSVGMAVGVIELGATVHVEFLGAPLQVNVIKRE
jgi:hypothetical protein